MINLQKKATNFANWFSKATRVLALVASIALFVLLIYNVADVTGRYLFNRPMFASYEFTQIFLVGIVFFSLAYVQHCKEHIRLDVLSYRVSPRTWAVLSLLTYITGLFIFSLVIWQGLGWTWATFLEQRIIMGASGITMWPSQLAMLIGATVFCIQYVIDIIQTMSHIIKPIAGEKLMKEVMMLE